MHGQLPNGSSSLQAHRHRRNLAQRGSIGSTDERAARHRQHQLLHPVAHFPFLRFVEFMHFARHSSPREAPFGQTVSKRGWIMRTGSSWTSPSWPAPFETTLKFRASWCCQGRTTNSGFCPVVCRRSPSRYLRIVCFVGVLVLSSWLEVNIHTPSADGACPTADGSHHNAQCANDNRPVAQVARAT